MFKYNKTVMDANVFSFIYGCAMRDAILQRSFHGERRWVANVPEAQMIVKKYIERVINGEFSQAGEDVKLAHDEAFCEAAIQVCDAINGYPQKPAGCGPFEFGNAQKLINMTVKHVYLHTYTMNLLNLPQVRERFRYCHCPMDSIMLQKVWELRKSKLDSTFRKPWGNEAFECDETTKKQTLPKRYKLFQNTILDIIAESNGDVFPIEFDYIIWKN